MEKWKHSEQIAPSRSLMIIIPTKAKKKSYVKTIKVPPWCHLLRTVTRAHFKIINLLLAFVFFSGSSSGLWHLFVIEMSVLHDYGLRNFDERCDTADVWLFRLYFVLYHIPKQ